MNDRFQQLASMMLQGQQQQYPQLAQPGPQYDFPSIQHFLSTKAGHEAARGILDNLVMQSKLGVQQQAPPIEDILRGLQHAATMQPGGMFSFEL